ncbi:MULTISPECIES: sigma-54-dependent transcriptional regulator [Vibrio]|jgi:two-component system response regulator FlrC|uniref:Sigma-54-dependent Fis family transcriptional regulator n=1 Tax=Vibrio natriegens NBRC 15636 = ATCC 14048 = DSM 759 TaxID=1219067 RepID=A0AAN0Y3D9_VIBNA|nr:MULTISPECIES: sigma-54 dependent transcriptional regulator [Vibrio]MEE3879640.1 sigma-54 dependent transcriptional regulator [Vibrio sp. YYF0003]CAH0531407.1 Regulatory protein AtoC [Catenococcus thiocycli]AEX22796.1 flagellar regulatory protein FleQ [Vibrio sp. EJY3]ALR14921.1 Fis family transcriptional regulator [Vibrio natriegens NBRC 15636 = ATCC 14048 = DSM 759]ANQ13215.1 sigma-54-dependent Fis family transcriptional regulator [Vibrio natriegens NBRC 15636 = ATCC 14048 = DSM 759]
MAQSKVLIVEDDEGLREALVDTLALAGYEWLEAGCAEEALVKLKSNTVDIVVSDVQMAGMGGLALLKNIKQNWPNLPVLLMTAYANIEDAVSAMKDGAIDYMAKPFAPEVLLNMVSRYAPIKSDDSGDAVVADEKSLRLLALAERVARTDANVMILGPSGSGKEVMSRYIHNASSRKDGPFVAINCAAIPDNMLEATLFGYEKGAFTGAVQACPGKFEQAQGGTILLDEISEMDLNLQAKLLRVLQEREVERLGSRKSIKLDVRVLATSNRDLKQYVSEGNFREDLYYRLNVFPIAWPALCERKGDIEPLAKHLAERHCGKMGMPVPKISASAVDKLLNYPWPGNVRELDNVVQRALILSENGDIDGEHILLEGVDWQDANSLQRVVQNAQTLVPDVKPVAQAESVSRIVSGGEGLGSELRDQEYAIILDTLVECNGRRKDMADKLGISPRTLRYKLAKMRDAGIDIPN